MGSAAGDHAGGLVDHGPGLRQPPPTERIDAEVVVDEVARAGAAQVAQVDQQGVAVTREARRDVGPVGVADEAGVIAPRVLGARPVEVDKHRAVLAHRGVAEHDVWLATRWHSHVGPRRVKGGLARATACGDPGLRDDELNGRRA